MAGNKLFVHLLWRFLLLIITCLGVAFLAFRVLEGEKIFTLVAGLLMVLVQVYLLSQYILRIHRLLVTFVDSVGSEVATELRFRERYPYLHVLESRLNDLKTSISLSRMEERKQKVLLKMVVDSMDPGLICIDSDGDVIFTNKPARKLLKNLPLGTLGEIRKHHPELAAALDTTRGCSSKVASLPSFKASVRCNSFVLGKGAYILFSIQNIQNEVDAQETESWQKLIRVLTHEIMNSLGPILSLSKSLKKAVSDRGKLLEGLDTIESTGEGLVHFITEYRKLSTLPPPTKELTAFSLLFSHIESLFKEECKKWGVEMKIAIASGLPGIHADRHQIEQVLINLVRNALESLEGSDSAVLSLTVTGEPGMVVIRVKDNGPGIPEEIAESIFIPFYSTKKGGSGIGLSLSRQIMLNHGGSLGFESNPGEFTVFFMRFPV